MANIIIRDASFDDVETIKQLAIDYYDNLKSQNASWFKATSDQIVTREEILIAIHNGLCVLSEIDQKAVGFILLQQFERSWFIKSLIALEGDQNLHIRNGLISYAKMRAEIEQILSINLICFDQGADQLDYYITKKYSIMPKENLSEQFKNLVEADAELFDADKRICLQQKIDIDKF